MAHNLRIGQSQKLSVSSDRVFIRDSKESEWTWSPIIVRGASCKMAWTSSLDNRTLDWTLDISVFTSNLEPAADIGVGFAILLVGEFDCSCWKELKSYV